MVLRYSYRCNLGIADLVCSESNLALTDSGYRANVVLSQNEKEIKKYFHKGAYINWHCTKEHFTVDEFIMANCEYPGNWAGENEKSGLIL